MVLFKDVDRKATVNNVRELFEKDLPKLEIMAGTYLKSVNLNSTPSGGSHTNSALEKMTRQVWAIDQLKKINNTVELLPDEMKQMIKLRYFDHLKWNKICEMKYFGERRAQQLLADAFVQFAYGYHEATTLLVEL